MASLLIGCGNSREKRIKSAGREEWSGLVTEDIDPNSGADVEHNLERLPLPFPDESFDEIHAYHTLEHTGQQGDYRFFFAQWSDFWRILKPDGLFCGIVPAPGSVWVFGDPGHTRAFPPELLVFLDQGQYIEQVGRTAMADYRSIYRADFRPAFTHIQNDEFTFVLKAIKPSRITLL